MPITFEGVPYLRVHELPVNFVKNAPLTTGIIIELRRGMHVGCAMCQMPLSKEDDAVCNLTANRGYDPTDPKFRCSLGFIYIREDDAKQREKYNTLKIIWMSNGYETRAAPDVCSDLDNV